jgi:hypothetical protein
MCEKRPHVVWQRSTRCSSAQCVEVARVEAARVGTARTVSEVRVRDSKDPRSPELAFGPAAWHTFIEGVKHGDLDHRR